MRHEFEDKVAIITGGGTGIGLATAKALLAEGAKGVVINGRRADGLETAARSIDPEGLRVVPVAGDIADPETGGKLVAVAVEQFGGLDILVNNAGVFRPTPFVDHDVAEFDRYLDIILKGTFFATQAAVPELRRRGGGAVVNVGSMWAEEAVGATPSSAYSAAKAGVHALTRNLAIELAADGIRVNAVAPAVVETPVYDTFMTPQEVAATLPTFESLHPLGRNGQPEDIASAILFLASAGADWVTGTVLPVDGGVLVGRAAP